jgi:hypothetical protein
LDGWTPKGLKDQLARQTASPLSDVDAQTEAFIPLSNNDTVPPGSTLTHRVRGPPTVIGDSFLPNSGSRNCNEEPISTYVSMGHSKARYYQSRSWNTGLRSWGKTRKHSDSPRREMRLYALNTRMCCGCTVLFELEHNQSLGSFWGQTQCFFFQRPMSPRIYSHHAHLHPRTNSSSKAQNRPQAL